MLEKLYRIKCDGGHVEGFERAKYCQINTGGLWATSQDARAAARRLKWWRRTGDVRGGVDLCVQCAEHNGVL